MLWYCDNCGIEKNADNLIYMNTVDKGSNFAFCKKCYDITTNCDICKLNKQVYRCNKEDLFLRVCKSCRCKDENKCEFCK